jgi:hypothetical protein
LLRLSLNNSRFGAYPWGVSLSQPSRTIVVEPVEAPAAVPAPPGPDEPPRRVEAPPAPEPAATP